MPLFYALIARGKNVVLCEYTARTGNFATVTRVLLGKIGAEDAKMSYVYGAWYGGGQRPGAPCPRCEGAASAQGIRLPVATTHECAPPHAPIPFADK